MTLVYVVRSFPKLSETFVLREVREHVRQGRPIVVWTLRPVPGEELPAEDVDDVADRVRAVPPGVGGVLRLIASSIAMALRHPVRFVRNAAFAARWAVAERDPRHLAALPFATYIAARLPEDAHVHSHFANTPATVGLLAARLSGRSFSFTGHARDLYVVTSKAFLRAKVSAASFVALGSEFARERVAEAVGPELADRLVIVRNGLDALDMAAPRLGARSEPPVIASVGRLVEKKGHATLVEASALLASRGVAHRCAIVGDGPLAGELEEQIERTGAPVSLLGAREPHAVRELIDSATVFALACQPAADGDSDTMPLAILEAMSRGVPVVTTAIAGIPEVVRAGESGLFVEPQDAAALAAALERLLRDPALAAELGERARHRADEFDVHSNVKRLYSCAAAGEPVP